MDAAGFVAAGGGAVGIVVVGRQHLPVAQAQVANGAQVILGVEGGHIAGGRHGELALVVVAAGHRVGGVARLAQALAAPQVPRLGGGGAVPLDDRRAPAQAVVAEGGGAAGASVADARQPLFGISGVRALPVVGEVAGVVVRERLPAALHELVERVDGAAGRAGGGLLTEQVVGCAEGVGMGAVGAGASDLVSLCAARACNDGLVPCHILDRRSCCLTASHAGFKCAGFRNV